MFKLHKTKIVFLLICVIYLQLACSTNRYRQPISKFQSASAVVSSNARKSYSESNRLNRVLEIKRRSRQGEFITKSELDKVQFFDDKDLQARFGALDRLNDYVDLLVSIANSDAPENISKSATDLTAAMTNLTNTVASIPNKNFNGSTFQAKTINAFNLGGVIVSEVLKAFVQKKIKQGLEIAISKGAAPIDELIDALSKDLETINNRYVLRFESERDEYQTFYNCELNKKIRRADFAGCPADPSPFSQGTLDGYRNQIITFEDTLETLRAANPKESLDKMKAAHKKIVALAKSNSPADFAETVAAIEDFAAAAKRLGDAVEKLKNS